MAATINITWTPANDGNSTGQLVQYREVTSGGYWTTFPGGSVSPSTNSFHYVSLNDNFIYQFRVVDLCTFGGPTSSSTVTKIKINVCLHLTVTSTSDTVGFVLTTTGPIGHDITKYVIDLILVSSGLVIQTKTYTDTSVVITDSFTGLTPSTAYQVRLTTYAGATFDYNAVCTPQSISTTS